MNLPILSRFVKQMVSRVPIRTWEIAYPLAIAVLAGVYFIAGRFGLRFAILDENVTLVWGATAIALAAMLLGGIRLWPGVAIGAFFVNLTTGIPLSALMIITVGDTLGPVVATYILRNVTPFKVTFDQIRDVVTFTLVGVLVTSLITSVIGTFALIAAN